MTMIGTFISEIDDGPARSGDRAACKGRISSTRRSGWIVTPRDDSALLTTGLADGRFVSHDIDWGSSGIPLYKSELLTMLDEWYGSIWSENASELQVAIRPQIEELRSFVESLKPDRLYALVTSEL